MLGTAFTFAFGSVNVSAAVAGELPASVTEDWEIPEEVTVQDDTPDMDERIILSKPETLAEPEISEQPEALTEPEVSVQPHTLKTEQPDNSANVKSIATYGPVTVLSDGKAYLSDENGNRITTAGTPIVEGNKYYVAPDGYLRSGWLYLGSWKMYFDTTLYTARTGMSDIDGKKYLFNNDGIMANYAGTPVINGKKYWFSTDNASLKTGWLVLGQWKLYFDPATYSARIGMADIDGHRYLFNDDGVMQNYAGTPIINGKKYWFSTDGYLKTGWLVLGQWKLYFDPATYAAKTGLSDIGGKKYLFNDDGVMANYAGTPVINGKKYWFSTDDASLKTGWLNLGNMKMYFDPVTYQGAVGVTNINGEYYFFNNDCVWLEDRDALNTFIWPCPGYTLVTSDYGYRKQPTAGASTNHKGIDIGAPYGSNIVAASDGTVIAYGYSSSMGNYVKLQHANGLQTIYMHMSRIGNLSTGQKVSSGATIGYVGSTGVSTGPHLHFAALVNGDYVSPWNYLSRP